jgi:perosamine synthetase
MGEVMTGQIPVNRPKIYADTFGFVKRSLNSGWLSSEGPFVKQFESEFASYLSVPFASSTNSGTAALHLAVAALGIGPGDEVIVPALTIASCYFAIWHVGATAVPIDADPEIYCINPNLIERAITKRAKAIMAVHLFGHPCDMDPIMKIAKKHHLYVIEDAAEAHGAEYKRKKVGTIGDIGIFSFYANKIVTTGEGGMVVTKTSSLIKKMNALKTLHHSRERFIHDGIGYNYLMSSLQAAVGLSSLKHIQSSIDYKEKMAKLYKTHLSTTAGLILPTEKPWAKSVYWMYAVCINTDKTKLKRQAVMEALKKQGIQTRPFFYPPNRAFAKMGLYKDTHFPVAERLAKNGFYIPSGLGNTPQEFLTVAQTLSKILKK